jgi:hypothetical protein
MEINLDDADDKTSGEHEHHRTYWLLSVKAARDM